MQLDQSLSGVGVVVQQIHDPDTAYEDSVVELTCPWIAERLEIQIVKAWCPDGENVEVNEVRVAVEGVIVASLSVARLRRTKLCKPLRCEVLEFLKNAIASVTGKKNR